MSHGEGIARGAEIGQIFSGQTVTCLHFWTHALELRTEHVIVVAVTCGVKTAHGSCNFVACIFLTPYIPRHTCAPVGCARLDSRIGGVPGQPGERVGEFRFFSDREGTGVGVCQLQGQTVGLLDRRALPAMNL